MLRPPPPSPSKLFNFYAVFGKKLLNNILAHPLWKILDPPLIMDESPFGVELNVKHEKKKSPQLGSGRMLIFEYREWLA